MVERVCDTDSFILLTQKRKRVIRDNGRRDIDFGTESTPSQITTNSLGRKRAYDRVNGRLRESLDSKVHTERTAMPVWCVAASYEIWLRRTLLACLPVLEYPAGLLWGPTEKKKHLVSYSSSSRVWKSNGRTLALGFNFRPTIKLWLSTFGLLKVHKSQVELDLVLICLLD